MKIIFVLDDQSILVANPEEIQLRQIEAGLSALVLPAGKNEAGEGLFYPLMTYPVAITVIPPSAPIPAPETTEAPVQKPELVKSKGKKKA
jgi:hypothetical protein